MRPKTFRVFEMCIENGIALGYQRAFKHNDAPPEEVIKDSIHNAIMSEISEWFDIDESL